MVLRARLLYLLSFIMNSATGVLVVAIPLLAIRFGAGPITLGVLGSLGPLVYTLACPLAGRISDENASPGGLFPGVSRRRTILLGCALLVFVDLCIVFVSSIKDVLIMGVCGSFCAALFWPAIQAWLTEIEGGGSLSDRLGNFNLSWSLGIMIGPMIGGYLYEIDYRFPWYYAVASAICVLLILGSSGGAAPRRSPADPADGGPEARTGVGVFLPLALWANFVCWFCLANIQALYPKYALSVGFSPGVIGILLFLVGVAQSVFFVVLRSRPSWQFRYRPLVFTHAAAGAGMFMLCITDSIPLLSIAFLPLGCALGLSYYSSIYYSLNGFADRGRRAGIHEQMVGSGFFLGPITGGIIASFLGLRAPFLVCALLLIGTSALEGILGMRTKWR